MEPKFGKLVNKLIAAGVNPKTVDEIKKTVIKKDRTEKDPESSPVVQTEEAQKIAAVWGSITEEQKTELGVASIAAPTTWAEFAAVVLDAKKRIDEEFKKALAELDASDAELRRKLLELDEADAATKKAEEDSLMEQEKALRAASIDQVKSGSFVTNKKDEIEKLAAYPELVDYVIRQKAQADGSIEYTLVKKPESISPLVHGEIPPERLAFYNFKKLLTDALQAKIRIYESSILKLQNELNNSNPSPARRKEISENLTNISAMITNAENDVKEKIDEYVRNHPELAKFGIGGDGIEIVSIERDDSKKEVDVSPAKYNREDFPETQATTRTPVTQKLLDYVAEVAEVEKYTDDLAKGEYTGWLQSLGDAGYEVAKKLSTPRNAFDVITQWKKTREEEKARLQKKEIINPSVEVKKDIAVKEVVEPSYDRKIYFKYADNGEGFSIDSVKTDPNSESIFEVFVQPGGKKAFYKISSDRSAQLFSLTNYARYLGKAAHFTTIPSPNSTITSTGFGELELSSDGKEWRIIKPVPVEFDADVYKKEESVNMDVEAKTADHNTKVEKVPAQVIEKFISSMRDNNPIQTVFEKNTKGITFIPLQLSLGMTHENTTALINILEKEGIIKQEGDKFVLENKYKKGTGLKEALAGLKIKLEDQNKNA